MAYKVISDVLDERTFDEYKDAMAYVESYGFKLCQSLLVNGGWVYWYKSKRGVWLKHVAYIVDAGEPYSPHIDEDVYRAECELRDEIRMAGEEVPPQPEKALAAWTYLDDVCVDEDDCIDLDHFVPHLGYYPKGTFREDIWHDIEDKLRVSVAWLMGEAHNVNGSNN